MLRIEVYEKYAAEGCKYSLDWWLENMPEGTPYPGGDSSYRRTMPLVDTIERPIEIPGSKDEFIIRFWSGEEMVCKGDYDDFCIQLNDIEQQMIMDEE